MAFAVITNTGDNDGAGTVTTDGNDSSGGDGIILGKSEAVAGTDGLISDSKGNTYVGRTESSNAGTRVRIYDTATAGSPTVGSSHTWTDALVSGNIYPFLAALVVSGMKQGSAFDVQNGATGSSPLATGSVTPTEDNELFVTMAGEGGLGGTFTINSSFTVTNQFPLTAATCEGGAMAYKIQTTGGAENPTWTNTGGLVLRIATYKAAAAAGGTINKLHGLIGGAGLIRKVA